MTKPSCSLSESPGTSGGIHVTWWWLNTTLPLPLSSVSSVDDETLLYPGSKSLLKHSTHWRQLDFPLCLLWHPRCIFFKESKLDYDNTIVAGSWILAGSRLRQTHPVSWNHPILNDKEAKREGEFSRASMYACAHACETSHFRCDMMFLA